MYSLENTAFFQVQPVCTVEQLQAEKSRLTCYQDRGHDITGCHQRSHQSDRKNGAGQFRLRYEQQNPDEKSTTNHNALYSTLKRIILSIKICT